MYLQLMHHLDSEVVPAALLQETSVEVRARELERLLSDMGIQEFSADQLLKVGLYVFQCLLLSLTLARGISKYKRIFCWRYMTI